MDSILAPPRGMRDFYPEDYRLREKLFQAWIDSGKIHGFEFFDAPVVETMELLERKAGEEISEQIYTFEDKSNRRLALRPELTPSLARMIIARQKALLFPLKWSAIVQCFRYERMTRGRKREHYQWNLDIINESSQMAELEVISTAIDALKKLGLNSDDFKVRIGSRILLKELFSGMKLDDKQLIACYLVLDKRGKVNDEEITKMLVAESIDKNNINNMFNILAIKNIDEASNLLPKDSVATKDLSEFFSLAVNYGIADFLEFDISIIRGLGYYTGTVFEAYDVNRKLRAIFGGGRYNNLLSSLGGEAMPCVGLGFGDVVVMELLADCNKLPSSKPHIEYSVGFMDDSAKNLAISITKILRNKEKSCDLGLNCEKAKNFFKRSDRIGAEFAIYLGPDEVQSGKITIKTMATATSKSIIIDEFKKL